MDPRAIDALEKRTSQKNIKTDSATLVLEACIFSTEYIPSMKPRSTAYSFVRKMNDTETEDDNIFRSVNLVHFRKFIKPSAYTRLNRLRKRYNYSVVRAVEYCIFTSKTKDINEALARYNTNIK